MFREMRRSDRELSEEDAYEILRISDYGVMSSVSDEGIPYGVPINYCLIDENIYFHSACKGHKIDNIEENPKVSFCVVGEDYVLPEQFSTRYESAVVFGTSTEVFGEEKQAALEQLLKKYSPEYFSKGLEFIEENDSITRVFKIAIERITGKYNE